MIPFAGHCILFEQMEKYSLLSAHLSNLHLPVGLQNECRYQREKDLRVNLKLLGLEMSWKNMLKLEGFVKKCNNRGGNCYKGEHPNMYVCNVMQCTVKFCNVHSTVVYCNVM